MCITVSVFLYTPTNHLKIQHSFLAKTQKMEAVVVICCYICVKYNNTNNNHSLSNINIVVAVSTTMHSSNSNYDNI